MLPNKWKKSSIKNITLFQIIRFNNSEWFANLKYYGDKRLKHMYL